MRDTDINTGKEYELFVARLQQAILSSENIAAHENIVVETDKKLMDNCGVERQFDIFWEYQLGGFTYKTVIECKDYDSNVSVDKIDALIGKVQDLPDLRAVFATKKGYQSGAKAKAEHNKIDLLIVREQNDSDWTAPEGSVRVRKLCIEVIMSSPARILKFDPLVDGEWVRSNTNIDICKPMSISGQSDQIVIDDVDGAERYSLYDLANKLSLSCGKDYGVFEKVEKFENAFICFQDVRLKVVSYKLRYSIPEPLKETIEIDVAKEIVGVIEYLQKGTKKSVLRNGMIWDTPKRIQVRRESECHGIRKSWTVIRTMRGFRRRCQRPVAVVIAEGGGCRPTLTNDGAGRGKAGRRAVATESSFAPAAGFLGDDVEWITR